MPRRLHFQQILGIRFFVGDVQQAIDLVAQTGGLVVVPSGPALCNLATDPVYREALLGADLAIADSAFMVLLWNLLHRPKISKLSGLRYLRALLVRDRFRKAGASFWVMPSQECAAAAVKWLNQQGVEVAPTSIYVAPFYNGRFEDPALIEAIELERPQHVVLGIGGGAQEPLGLYLKHNLSYLPAIHCVGAAVAFLAGDQVHIPIWTDQLGLGWLWRIVSDPRRYLPRYWNARHLAKLMMRNGERLPVARASSDSA